MADQCFASVTNFAVGVAVARLAGPAGLGAFSLAYTCWILLNNIHRSFVTNPMAISGDVRMSGERRNIEPGFAAEIVIGLAATAVFAVTGAVLLVFGQHAFGMGMIAVSPWLVFLDLQDYWRWIGFMEGRPDKALVNDAVFALAQGVTFAGVMLAGVHSVVWVVSAWGAGAFVSAVFGLRQFDVRPALRGGIGLLRERWQMSKWLAGTTLTNWGASQLYLIIAGGILGPVALGGLKAAQNLVTGPSSVVINASGSFGLPEGSRAFADRGWHGLQRVSHWVTAAGVASVGLFGGIVVVVGGPLLRIVYGSAFAAYEPAARFLAVAGLVGAFGLGPILTLKATARTRPLFGVQVITLAVAVPAVAVFGVLDGASGAAASALVSSVVNLAALLLCRHAARRALAADSQPPPRSKTVGTPRWARTGVAPEPLGALAPVGEGTGSPA